MNMYNANKLLYVSPQVLLYRDLEKSGELIV